MVDFSPDSSFDDHDYQESSTSSDLYGSHATPSLNELYDEADAFGRLLRDIDALNGGEDGKGDHGFARLVAKHLDSAERAEVGRTVKLDTTGTSWTDSELTTEPSTYNDSEGESDEKTGEQQSDDRHEKQPSQFQRSTITKDGQPWALDSQEISRLLVQEFGSLSQAGEEEEVILEADGCFWLNGVFVVGVIHLTTHRLAFHASLLSTRPDMPQSQKIVKSGPALLYSRSKAMPLRPKRLWLELTHDMMTMYQSSQDEDRIKPKRTVLLSNVEKIERKSPTAIMIQMRGGDGIAEFDTQEAASEWRRELEGAVFLDRHRRREALTSADSEDSSGIRLSVPLDKITAVKRTNDRFHFSSIHLDLGQGLVNDTPDVLTMAPMVLSDTWRRLDEHVESAKKRTKPDGSERPVIIDFGPLSFSPTLKVEDVAENPSLVDQVRSALALSADQETWIARGRISGNICYSGNFVVTPHFVGFWCKAFGREDVKYRLPAEIVKLAQPVSTMLWSHGLALKVEGYNDLRFQFKSKELRDEAVQRVNAMAKARGINGLGTLKRRGPPSPTRSDHSSLSASTSSSSPSPHSTAPSTPLSEQPPSLSSTSGQSVTNILSPQARTRAVAIALSLPPQMRMNIPKAINIDPKILSYHKSLHFVCLTIGSRGDVQPYIALGLRLKEQNHTVTIVTHDEYKAWVEGFGLTHKTAGGDPAALMKLSVENKMFSPEFFREKIAKFRPWLDELLLEAWEACQGADVLLESPSAMAGVHIAEALHIPYFRTFTMPWSKTSAFPHPFLAPPVESTTFNTVSHILFSTVMWAATSGQINRWRTNTLKIGATDYNQLAQSKIVYIYNFSEAVVPKPLDWGDTTIISGYWFLDNPDLKWSPPKDLMDWMDQARRDNKPIVYIGFGSITVPHPNRVTTRIIKAVLQSDVRAIIGKGWSGRCSQKVDDPEPEIPKECYMVDSIPHDWLFPKIDAVLHHGGAGTTGASLRAGVPTLIKPWFGDQYFWASRVQKLGAGLKVPSLRVNDLAEALTKATTNTVMREKALAVGERIRAEDGVHNAINTIYTYLNHASQDRNLVRKISQRATHDRPFICRETGRIMSFTTST
ncbi:hypothetical protein V5O48_003367 [Marasmius crinis-equi]|uniref:PH domain-containing protein n=1 Tax=Marasmius crinis-equi TaxID=585013 RepID=A0ABR3FT36_9AGAR